MWYIPDGCGTHLMNVVNTCHTCLMAGLGIARTTVPRYHNGRMVQRYHGTMVSTMVQWYNGTTVPWYHGFHTPACTWVVLCGQPIVLSMSACRKLAWLASHTACVHACRWVLVQLVHPVSCLLHAVPVACCTCRMPCLPHDVPAA